MSGEGKVGQGASGNSPAVPGNGSGGGDAAVHGQKPSNRLLAFQTTVELVRALVWPILIAGILFVYRGPLGDVIDQFPIKFMAATKVGLGGLSLEIQERARAAGNPELALRLGKLSPEAIKLLIEIGDSHMILVGESHRSGDGERFYFPDDQRLSVVRELADNGLIEFREDLDDFLDWMRSGPFRRPADSWQSNDIEPTRTLTEEERDRLREQYYKLNDFGQKAWNTVLQAVLEQLKSAPNAPAASGAGT